MGKGALSLVIGVLAAAEGGGDLVGGLILPILALGGAIYLFYRAYKALWRRRLLENIPTSKCAGITVGLNELKGQALSRRSMRSYLTEKDTVYYRYTIEEQWKKRTRDNKGRTRTEKGWKTIKSGEQRPRFTLRDETGDVRVDPTKAEVEGVRVLSKTCRRSDPLYYGKGPARGIANSTGRRRFQEYVIENGQEIYLIGPARMRDDIVALEIAHDELEEIYLISTKSEEKIISGYGWRMRFSLFFSIILAVLVPPLLDHGFSERDLLAAMGEQVVWMVLAGMMVVMVFAVFYLKAVFNGLVYVRNRVDRAWSMIDVELKRRHDLIPNLLEIVQAQMGHEREAMEALVRARQMLPARSAAGVSQGLGESVEQQSRALGLIFAVVERYPRLKSDGTFYKLMEELTRCEDKLALARNGYNDCVEALNNRVETVPDMFFAPLARVEARPLLEAMHFEKKPIEVRFHEEPEPEVLESPVESAGE